MTATAAEGYTFIRWDGTVPSTSNVISITLPTSEEVTTKTFKAIFEEKPSVPPTANAGPDQTVESGTTVTLDGSGSSASDGTIALYSWEQLSGTGVALSDNNAQKPTFTAPNVTAGSTAALTFR
ncbi:MAG TPA: PKD domain-containing protein, partial [Syntrophales bacterium]|nr:PKD domain-containing protein [Syntrophales bacterium]